MRILFLTDNYTWNIYGTKRSTAEALKDAGHSVFIIDVTEIQHLPELAKRLNPDQIWLFHSDLRLPAGMKESIAQPVIGFGISDPYYFSKERFNSYDAYVTYNKDTYLKVRSLIPTVYNRTACDLKFHRKIDTPTTCDATMIGQAMHVRFTKSAMRVEYVNRLREDTCRTIHAYGNGWPEHNHNFKHIDGEEFLPAVCSGTIGLDIQDAFSPLAHRMFEYAACGVPVITRKREEVFESFEEGKEILSYTNYDELKDIFIWYITHPDKLYAIGQRAQDRCRKEHDITHRIPKLVAGLTKVLGIRS